MLRDALRIPRPQAIPRGVSNQYLERAEEAERLARIAPTEQEREAHLKVAQIWRELAERRDRKVSNED